MTTVRNIVDYSSAGVVLTMTVCFNQINVVLTSMVGHIGDILTLGIQGATLVYIVAKTAKLFHKDESK